MSDNACPCRGMHERTRSPFEIVQLGWYDGITSGLAKCRECGQTFYFDMLGWDEEQWLRIYAFAAIAAESYEHVSRVDREGPSTAAGALAGADAVMLAVRDAVAGAFGRTMFVLAQDLEKEVLASRPVDFAALKDFVLRG